MMCEQLPSAICRSKEFEHGFVHRLDVPSSGLILAGTSFEGYALLQFRMHTYRISREYVVLLHGAAPASLHIMDAAINDFASGHSVMDGVLGRPAVSHVHICTHFFEEVQRVTLVCFAIYTGRRHQIRVHSQYCGHST